MVPNNKFQSPPSIVSIILLMTPSDNEVLTDEDNFVNNLLNVICSKEMLIPNFILIGWGSTWPTIQSFIWSHINIRVIVVIAHKLDKGEILIPIATNIQYTCTQHILQRLNALFRLSISLWKVTSAEVKAGAKSLLETFQKGEVKRGSLSKIPKARTPQSLTISPTYNMASLLVE